MENTCGIILAGGRGSRFKTDAPKPLYKIGQTSMIELIIDALKICNVENILIVVSPTTERFYKFLSNNNVKLVVQKEPLGTFHALYEALYYVNSDKIIVIPGDKPFIDPLNIKQMLNHKVNTILAYESSERKPVLVTDKDLHLDRIIEDLDQPTEFYKKYPYRTGGVYCFNTKELKKLKLDIDINKNNKQNEYYLTDIFENNIGVTKVICVDKVTLSNINTLEEVHYYTDGANNDK